MKNRNTMMMDSKKRAAIQKDLNKGETDAKFLASKHNVSVSTIAGMKAAATRAQRKSHTAKGMSKGTVRKRTTPVVTQTTSSPTTFSYTVLGHTTGGNKIVKFAGDPVVYELSIKALS